MQKKGKEGGERERERVVLCCIGIWDAPPPFLYFLEEKEEDEKRKEGEKIGKKREIRSKGIKTRKVGELFP